MSGCVPSDELLVFLAACVGTAGGRVAVLLVESVQTDLDYRLIELSTQYRSWIQSRCMSDIPFPE